MYKKENDCFVCDNDYEHTLEDETFYFEDLDEPVQEIIIDLLVSIIKNS